MIDKIFFSRLRLNTPTHFTYINGQFFIVDCWNNRIIYKKNGKFAKWKKIINLNKPHRIRFDENTYYNCDTDNNKIIKFDIELKNEKVLETILLERPHDIQVYNNNLYIVDCCQGTSRVICYNLLTRNSKIIFEIKGVYARSIKIIDKYLFLSCSSSGEIIRIELTKEYSAKKYCENKDGLHLSCMTMHEQVNHIEQRFIPNDVDYYDGYFYMTNYFYQNSKNKFIRFKTFEKLENNEFEDLSYLTKGVPYYLEVIGNDLYMGEIDNYSSVKILNSKNNNIKIKKVLK